MIICFVWCFCILDLVFSFVNLFFYCEKVLFTLQIMKELLSDFSL
jgi:hypothetical protein